VSHYILVVDNNDSIRRERSAMLQQAGYIVHEVSNKDDAISALNDGCFDLIITNLELNTDDAVDGGAIVKEAKRIQPKMAAIVMSPLTDNKNVVDIGTDVLVIPQNSIAEDILLSVSIALKSKRVVNGNQDYEEGRGFNGILSTTPAMQEVIAQAQRIADTDSSVLLLGETGTGKSMIARAIHYRSSRRDKEFVEINCGAIPETLQESELFGHVKGAFTDATSDKTGLIQAADRGTVFLDEIGEMIPTMQVKLLHFLESNDIRRVGDTKSKRVDCRVIAATNKNLEEAIYQKEFREDLFYRLNVISIRIPSLRERKVDIPHLVEQFLDKFALKHRKPIKGIFKDALNKLLNHTWPGNVRELENVIERSVLLSKGDEITQDDIFITLSSRGRFNGRFEIDDMTIKELEKSYILHKLKQCDYNHTLAAEKLGIGRTTLWRKLSEYGEDDITLNSHGLLGDAELGRS